MSCLLPLLAGLCLANPSELRLEVDASAQFSGDFDYWDGRRSVGGGLLGRVSISMDVPVTEGFTVRYGILHESLLDSREDRGQERVFAGFIYRPWVR